MTKERRTEIMETTERIQETMEITLTKVSSTK